ncbi:DinB family protein [Hymenobacter terricola]|uniref:DinB family protein n=1 Tax=Hymenobacter terricola TaxID=2819236 RepID=UPI001B30F72D|nr:DinB family protein [Hymenobacter terricola]
MEKHTREKLVAELVSLLSEGSAHATFEDACAGLTAQVWNQHVPDVPYTIWQLAEHIRIAQWDIVEFCLDPDHKSPKWPDAYWPKKDATADAKAWQATLAHIGQDRQRFTELLQNPATDLLTPLPHGTGQTILREAFLIGDHTAYHTGEIIMVRRLLHAWK